MRTLTKPSAVQEESPMVPNWAEIIEIVPEAEGVSTYWLEFKDEELSESYSFLPGQFNMLYLPGYGEAAISISSDASDRSKIGHTIRFVGNVTNAISRLKVGDEIGIRGPFGTPWPMDEIEGHDITIASGGIGLAPLRPAIYHILNNRERYGKIHILYGSRTPDDLLYTEEYAEWEKEDIHIATTVDRADDTWKGSVGVVPMLFYRYRLDAPNSVVLSCGPEIMIRFVIFEALARRVPADHLYVSLERNMKCGQGSCGHCQLGSHFICKDGPVFRFDQLEDSFNVEEY